MKKEYLSAYKISVFCLILIWILCLMPVPEVPQLEDVPFIDKWTHLVMYGGTCSMIWLEFLLKHRTHRPWKRLWIWALLAPILMSGLLELLQEYATNGLRSGDWLDFLANTVGVLLGACFGYGVLARYIPLRKE